MGGEANACFARSESIDLIDFLIHSNVLNIPLSRNLTLPAPIPDKEKKINLNFYFHTSLWCLKRFYESL